MRPGRPAEGFSGSRPVVFLETANAWGVPLPRSRSRCATPEDPCSLRRCSALHWFIFPGLGFFCGGAGGVLARRRCLEFAECRSFIESGSRCAMHKARIKQLRNRAAPIAKAVIAASPVCVDCGATEDLTGDHVVPLIRTRSNAGEWVTRCRPCNSRKGAR